MVFNYYGRQVSHDEINSSTDLSSGGISLLSMSEAAEKFGFETSGTRLDLEQLTNEINLPAILLWDQFHYVILYKTTTHRFFVADPAIGKVKLSKIEFLKHWVNTAEDDYKGIALLLQPGEGFKKGTGIANKPSETIGWSLLYTHLWKYKAYFFQIFVGLLIGSLFQLLLPFLTQSLVDVGINQQNLSFIYLVIIGQSVLFIGRLLIEFVRSRILLFISSHINITILSDFWIKLMRLPLSFFQIRQSGDIMQRVADHHRLEQFLTGGTINTLFSLTNLFVFSIVLYIYDWKIFLIFLVANCLYFFWIMLFVPSRRALDYRRFSINSRENSATMQLIFGMQDIKLNNSEQLKRNEWESLQSAIFNLSFSGLTLSQFQQAGAMIINEGKNIIITLFVAKAVLEGSMSFGTMLAIQYIVGQLSSPIEQLLTFFQQAQDAKISLSRLNEIHILKDEEPDGQPFEKNLQDKAGIHFRDVSFSYPGTGQILALEKITFSIPSGKVTAVVGMSGSGKSTLLKLLMQFYLAYDGNILVGKKNLRNISPSFWRSQCGCVMQEGYIFNDSIENNIVIDSKNIDREKLEQACKVANIWDYIQSLPMGFRTGIGHEGNGLSQGQRQRLLIARAVYKNPGFLFFDEATNALDANNERQIVHNLDQFFKNRTVVVIAHRLSTIQHADNILVLHEGKLVEHGNHSTLLNKNGYYYELVKNQFQDK